MYREVFLFRIKQRCNSYRINIYRVLAHLIRQCRLNYWRINTKPSENRHQGSCVAIRRQHKHPTQNDRELFIMFYLLVFYQTHAACAISCFCQVAPRGTNQLGNKLFQHGLHLSNGALRHGAFTSLGWSTWRHHRRSLKQQNFAMWMWGMGSSSSLLCTALSLHNAGLSAHTAHSVRGRKRRLVLL